VIWSHIESIRDQAALIENEASISYEQLVAQIERWEEKLCSLSIAPRSIVALQVDFSSQSIALLLALMRRGSIAVLLSAQADYRARLEETGATHFFRFGVTEYEHVRLDHGEPAGGIVDAAFPGFIILSSGSTGTPKAILHSFARYCRKFKCENKPRRILNLFHLDHIAGIDRLLSALHSASCLIIPSARDPQTVCELVQKHHAQVLPTSPSFCNLMLMTGAQQRHDLSSLESITYGSEPMPQSTLDLMVEAFPAIELKQTFGISEVGSLPVISRGSSELWIKPESDLFAVDIKEGMLWIKSQIAMLSYISGETPFTEDGWYRTGDLVEQDGEWFSILGRESDIIMVGGEKVYPREVESTLLQVDGIDEALVYGEDNPLMGQVVVADVNYSGGLDQRALQKLARKHCRSRLETYKVPIRLTVTEESLVNSRNKKSRSRAVASS